MKQILLLIPLLLLIACKGTLQSTSTVAVPVTTTIGAPSTTTPANSVGKAVVVGDGAYTNLSPAELQTMLAKKDFTFVNVHIPFEGNIATTDKSIAYNEISQKLDQLSTDKNAKIVLYCRSGRMSTEAAQTLVGLGYKHVFNLEGGMIAWGKAGFAVDDK